MLHAEEKKRFKNKLLKLKNKPKKTWVLSYSRTIDRFLNWLNSVYGSSLRGALKIRWLILIAAVLIMVFSAAFAGKMGFVLFPEADEGQFSAQIELPTGTRADEAYLIADDIEVYLVNSFPEIKLLSTSAGADDKGGIMAIFMESGNHIININAILVNQEDRDRDVWEISEGLRTYLASIPEIVNFIVTPNGGGMGGGMMSNNIAIEIFGYDFQKTSAVAQELADSLKLLPGASNVAISRDPAKPELQIIPNREKMAIHGLNTYFPVSLPGKTA